LPPTFLATLTSRLLSAIHHRTTTEPDASLSFIIFLLRNFPHVSPAQKNLLDTCLLTLAPPEQSPLDFFRRAHGTPGAVRGLSEHPWPWYDNPETAISFLNECSSSESRLAFLRLWHSAVQTPSRRPIGVQAVWSVVCATAPDWKELERLLKEIGQFRISAGCFEELSRWETAFQGDGQARVALWKRAEKGGTEPEKETVEDLVREVELLKEKLKLVTEQKPLQKSKTVQKKEAKKTVANATTPPAPQATEFVRSDLFWDLPPPPPPAELAQLRWKKK
jgi:hypothetical protein